MVHLLIEEGVITEGELATVRAQLMDKDQA